MDVGKCTAIFQLAPKYGGPNEYRIKSGEKSGKGCDKYFLTGDPQQPTALTIEGKPSNCRTMDGLDSATLEAPYTQGWICGNTEIYADGNVKPATFTGSD